MHAYIVFAHPTRSSFTGQVLDELCRGFDDGGHSYEIGDLYEMDFNCEMNLDEYTREMNVQGNRSTRNGPKGSSKRKFSPFTFSRLEYPGKPTSHRLYPLA